MGKKGWHAGQPEQYNLNNSLKTAKSSDRGEGS
jgi:hypothetical protein